MNKNMITVMLFLSGSAAYGLPYGEAQRPGERNSASSQECKWQAFMHPDRVRFPVQMDTHAAYAIYSFEAEASLVLRIDALFPFAAFMSLTTYDANGLLFDALLDRDVIPDLGSVNPFHEGTPVNAPDRSYRAYVIPYGSELLQDQRHSTLSMPPTPSGETSVKVVLVYRVYLPEPGLGPDGGVQLPIITATGTTLQPDRSCPAPVHQPGATEMSDLTGEIPGFGGVSGIDQAPKSKDGRIRFYRPPASGVPFADGSGQMTPSDCTTYLLATLDPDKVAVVTFRKVPQFFNNNDTTESTKFRVTQVRYLSLGSYGASLIPPLDSPLTGNFAGTDIRMSPVGSATFAVIPHGYSDSRKAEVIAEASRWGFQVLPMAAPGPLVQPFLVYRNKVPTDDFEGNIGKVPCYQGSFDRAPQDYAASESNMGPYAPQGVECTAEAFLHGSCGR